jgi:hypothetical protein
MKAFFLLIFLALSCTRYAEFNKNNFTLEITPVEMKITHLKEIKWPVGERREQKISQSFIFFVDLPKLRIEDLDYLIKERGVDSWIVRLIVERNSKVQDLGSVYAIFRPKRVSRILQTRGPSSVNLKIMYSAAYASERLRSLKCPALDHNKRITSMKILGASDIFSLNLSQPTPYREKSHPIEINPTAFNAGQSLIGDYFLEIAPYNSQKKVIFSSFKRIPLYINVQSEQQMAISGCPGIG